MNVYLEGVELGIALEAALAPEAGSVSLTDSLAGAVSVGGSALADSVADLTGSADEFSTAVLGANCSDSVIFSVYETRTRSESHKMPVMSVRAKS